jgi:hypothetical protein
VRTLNLTNIDIFAAMEPQIPILYSDAQYLHSNSRLPVSSETHGPDLASYGISSFSCVSRGSELKGSASLLLQFSPVYNYVPHLLRSKAVQR